MPKTDGPSDEKKERTGQFRLYEEYVRPTEPEVLAAASQARERMNRRRSVRDFSPEPVPKAVIEQCLLAASSAPSGANQQPWQFVAVRDPAIKARIREAAEAEERRFYQDRASKAWLEDLAPLGTDSHKPFLETAPWLIAVFAQKWHVDSLGVKHKHYYVNESVGLATGLLIAALHEAGLASLTHTPSPMAFLREVLQRPDTERPFLLLVTGYPAPETKVPDIKRKSLSEFATFR
jgi:nitroreductase